MFYDIVIGHKNYFSYRDRLKIEDKFKNIHK